MAAVGAAIVEAHFRAAAEYGGTCGWGHRPVLSFGWPFTARQAPFLGRPSSEWWAEPLVGNAFLGGLMIAATGWSFSRWFDIRRGRVWSNGVPAVAAVAIGWWLARDAGAERMWGWRSAETPGYWVRLLAVACCVFYVGHRLEVWGPIWERSRAVARVLGTRRKLVVYTAVLAWAGLVVWPHDPTFPLPVEAWFGRGGRVEVHYGFPAAWGIDHRWYGGGVRIEEFAPTYLALDMLAWALMVVMVSRSGRTSVKAERR